MSTLKWAAVFAILVAACGPFVLPATVWPKSAGDTTCDEWMQQMTPDQRSGLAKGILNDPGLWHPDRAMSAPGDHLSGLLAEAITRSCDPAGGPHVLGTGRISDVDLLQLQVHSGSPFQNCEWNSEPRTCDRRSGW
jgi:hypothetical protein